MSRASLRVPMDSVSSLPPGAWYGAQQGQASVRVSRDSTGRYLLVESACDSIRRRCLYLEEEITRIRSSTALLHNEQWRQEKEETQTSPHPSAAAPTGWQWFWIRTGQVLAAVGCAILLRRRWVKQVSI